MQTASPSEITQEKEYSYWDTVASTWQSAKPQMLWRLYSDTLHKALFSRWLPEDAVDFLLKTDLFDESLGDGLVSLLASKARKVVGIDISILTAQAAAARHEDLAAAKADARRLPFADETFDVIVSNSTLDHFRSAAEIKTSLREFWRVLKPSGELLITLDNSTNPAVGLRQFLPFSLLHDLKIVPYFVGATLGPRGFSQSLESSGFTVRDMEALMHAPRIVTMALLRRLDDDKDESRQKRILDGFLKWERLASWPTRFLTGYFLAARAVKNDFR